MDKQTQSAQGHWRDREEMRHKEKEKGMLKKKKG